MEILDFIGLFLLIAGLVIGLGAVTVIDWHGFLARRSSYWTVATTRSHKITKPLIWLGTGLVLVGGMVFYRTDYGAFVPQLQAGLVLIMIANGSFLTFSVSPFLLKREADGQDSEVLPDVWQNKIVISFLVSFVSWWTLVLTLVWYLVYSF